MHGAYRLGGLRFRLNIRNGRSALHVFAQSLLSSGVGTAKSLRFINGESGVQATGDTTWATRMTTWATDFTTWATVFPVAQVVKPLSGHEKRPPEGALLTLLSKDTTKWSEMQIALFREFSRKRFVQSREFPIAADAGPVHPSLASDKFAPHQHPKRFSINVPLVFALPSFLLILFPPSPCPAHLPAGAALRCEGNV